MTPKHLAIGFCAAVLAQAVSMKFQQGNRTIYFAWGEAALIITASLLPTAVIPGVMAIGALVGNALWRLRIGRPFEFRMLGQRRPTPTLAGLAGAWTVHAFYPDVSVDQASLPRPMVALVVGACRVHHRRRVPGQRRLRDRRRDPLGRSGRSTASC